MSFLRRLRYLPKVISVFLRGGSLMVNVRVEDQCQVFRSHSLILGNTFIGSAGINVGDGSLVAGDE